MATETYQTQLERVQTAIAAIENGTQAYSLTTELGTRAYTFADLATLYAREKELRIKAAREARGGIRSRGVTPVDD